MDITLIDRPEGLETVERELDAAPRFALDCEAAGFHRYSDRLCLVQLTVGRRTFLLDPFALPIQEVLRPALEDPDREVVMHGADFDLRLLDRDLGINLRGLFDTQVAAALLGIDGLGLQSLLDRTLGVRLEKKFQRADWARRPLPRPMQEYAALDTHHLIPMANRLADELDSVGRTEWAQEEFRELEAIRYEEPAEEDPVTRIRATRDMSDREVHRLRVCLEWRDEVARDLDRAPFRVAQDSVLVEAARANPRDVESLGRIRGMSSELARTRGTDLVKRFREVDGLPAGRIQGLPPRREGGRGRPPPEVEERMSRLKSVRNQVAREVGIERGTLLPNALLAELAEAPPEDLHAIHRVPGIRGWQARVAGPALLRALEDASAPAGD
jgi:ribonuclease D